MSVKMGQRVRFGRVLVGASTASDIRTNVVDAGACLGKVTRPRQTPGSCEASLW